MSLKTSEKRMGGGETNSFSGGLMAGWMRELKEMGAKIGPRSWVTRSKYVGAYRTLIRQILAGCQPEPEVPFNSTAPKMRKFIVSFINDHEAYSNFWRAKKTLTCP